MSADKIRILVDYDFLESKVNEVLDANIFEVQGTSLRDIGKNSAYNLTEYDAIILNYAKPNTVQPMRIDQLRNYLLTENKLLVFFLNQLNGKEPNSNLKLIGYLFELFKENLGHIIKVNNQGNKYDLTINGEKSILKKYLLSDYKKWEISFRESHSNIIVPLATNTDQETVALTLKHESIKAKVFLLPWIQEREKDFWEIIAEYLITNYVDFEDVDNWVKEYSFTKLEEINKNIVGIDESISSLEKQKNEFISKKQYYERIRNSLLYHDGDLLKDVSKEVLIELGLQVDEGKQGREDLVFVQNGEHYLIEVKGTEKSTSKTHIRQLNSHVIEYRNENEVDVKGILLINAWRKLPLEERGTVDKPFFPDDIMNLVNLSGVVLMTSQQLFVAYCENLEGKFNLNNFINTVKATKGILNGFNDVVEYKTK